MTMKEYEEEKALLTALEKRDVNAFIRFYKDYGEDALIFTYGLVQDSQEPNRIVDHLFDKLWAEANFEMIEPPIYKFLIKEIQKNYHQR